MSTITFDTLNFAKKLKEAGFSDQQAEVQAQALVQALAEHHERQKEELATKRDLADAKTDIIRWVAGLLMAQAAIIAALVKLLANSPPRRRHRPFRSFYSLPGGHAAPATS